MAGGLLPDPAAIPSPHDLLEIASPAALVPDEPCPSWVRTSLERAPFVVVRRARPRGPLVPVGVRGASRGERFGAWLPSGSALRLVRPEDLVASRAWRGRRDCPPLASLDAVADAMAALDLRWGPVGSVGFELATGVACVREVSDLDVVVRLAAARSREELCSLARVLSTLAARVDVQLETPRGAVALAEVAAGARRVVLRTADGPLLVADPWEAPGAPPGNAP
jgi:phosphoribosyl-dephospho-CoA transferase